MERLQELVTIAFAALAGMFGLLVQEITVIAMPLPKEPPHSDVLFVGDMMFDRSVRQAMENYGADFVFSCIATTLGQADYVVGNLEGPITANPSRSVGSAVGSHDNFVFTFPEYVAPLLKRQNVGAVSLGNNHILNFDMAGVDSTIRALSDAGVGYFGEPLGHSVSQIDSNDIPISYIGYNEFDSGWSASTTITEIIDARGKGRIPVVYAHWGDEYKAANKRQKDLAHRFIDAGAELVIGAHPHVVQEAEMYQGKHIFYSLGNFIFDQYWNEFVTDGLMVQVRFEESGVTRVTESHVTLGKDRRTCPTPAL
jgi:gamma-polyglutamate biosynthesis protein CapA